MIVKKFLYLINIVIFRQVIMKEIVVPVRLLKGMSCQSKVSCKNEKQSRSANLI